MHRFPSSYSFPKFKPYIASYLGTDRLQVVFVCLVGFFVVCFLWFFFFKLAKSLASVTFLNLKVPILLGHLSFKQTLVFCYSYVMLCSGLFQKG